MTNNKYHIPVLLNESLDILVNDTKGIYVDATFGGGGHSIFLLNKLHTKGIVLAFDQDKDSIINNCIYDTRLKLFNYNFRYINKILKEINVYEISGVIADLGLSYHQLDHRGLSTKINNELDMIINSSTQKTAKMIVNSYSEERLANILFKYGELKNARQIAKYIIRLRKKKSIDTTVDFINIINKIVQKKRFAQVFQSIRIEVNDEINALKDLLIHSYNLLKKKGRIVIISYHSIEDRIIKKFINYNYYLKMISTKIITPNKNEIILNPRSRSAKMRIAVKII